HAMPDHVHIAKLWQVSPEAIDDDVRIGLLPPPPAAVRRRRCRFEKPSCAILQPSDRMPGAIRGRQFGDSFPESIVERASAAQACAQGADGSIESRIRPVRRVPELEQQGEAERSAEHTSELQSREKLVCR